MLRNKHFEAYFIERFVYHLNTTFTPKSIYAKLDQFIDLYDPVIEDHIDRWGYPQSKDHWHHHINTRIRFFVEQRPCIMKAHLESFFKIAIDDFDCYKPADVDDETLLYPNPCKEILNVKLQSESPNFDWVITNVSGAVCLSGKETGRETNWTTQYLQLDVSSLLKGIYFLEILNPEGNEENIQFIKQ